MNDRISAVLAETHNSLREQLSAAQRHFDRLEQLLAARQSKDIAAINSVARRLSASEGDWTGILTEGAEPFANRAMVFTLRSGSLHLESGDGGVEIEDVPLERAPAFRAAVETKDTVVAVRTRGEMSAPIAAALGEDATDKFHVFPILAGERAVAILYADGPREHLQPDALELLATVAGAVRASRPAGTANGLVHIADSAERDLHRKAQRFARVQVAEIRLYQDEHVKTGRADGDLYASLREQIDAARETYRREFLAGSPETMADYLHQELVHTLAHGDVQLLGPDYPGPLV